MARFDLTDAEWAVIEPLMLAVSRRSVSEKVRGKSGRPPIAPCQPYRRISALPESSH